MPKDDSRIDDLIKSFSDFKAQLSGFQAEYTAFRSEHLLPSETKGIALRAPLPNTIADADHASVNVQSVDIPPEDGSYQAEAKLLENGAACQVTIYASERNRIKDRLSGAGITVSLLVSTPYTGVSQASALRLFATAMPIIPGCGA